MPGAPLHTGILAAGLPRTGCKIHDPVWKATGCRIREIVRNQVQRFHARMKTTGRCDRNLIHNV